MDYMIQKNILKNFLATEMYDLCITEINAKIEKKRIIMEFLSTALLFPRLRMKAQSMNNTCNQFLNTRICV